MRRAARSRVGPASPGLSSPRPVKIASHGPAASPGRFFALRRRSFRCARLRCRVLRDARSAGPAAGAPPHANGVTEPTPRAPPWVSERPTRTRAVKGRHTAALAVARPLRTPQPGGLPCNRRGIEPRATGGTPGPDPHIFRTPEGAAYSRSATRLYPPGVPEQMTTITLPTDLATRLE